MTKAVLLSIRPRFAEAILNGSKTYELRRRFPKLESGTTVYLYSSSPDMAIVGSFVTAEIRRADKGALWTQLRNHLGLDEDEFNDYLDDQTHGVGIRTTQVRRFRTPIRLSEIRHSMNVEAPQSFRYLPLDAETWLEQQLEAERDLAVVGQPARSFVRFRSLSGTARQATRETTSPPASTCPRQPATPITSSPRDARPR